MEVDNLGLVIACAVLSWILVHRWSQRSKVGPKTWPIIGAMIEQLDNYERMHEWLVEYLSLSRTVVVHMPFMTYTYIADPANVEHVLKSNFANYPKGKIYHSYMEVLLGEGIFNVDGEAWRKQRKTASFEFTSKNLRDFSSVILRDYTLKLSYEDDPGLYAKTGLRSKLGPSPRSYPFALAFDAANIIMTQR